MENYEEVTSYNNNNLKLNYNECKDYYEKNDCEKYRYKIEEGQTTPFLVKDILNINQTNYYERGLCDRERRSYEYETLYPQNQSYCPDYFGQVYPNLPVPSNLDYWNQEVYHEQRIEDYYNYNFCHNMYHQNYESYEASFAPPLPKPENVEKEVINVDMSPVKRDVDSCEFIVPETIPVPPQKNNSKFPCRTFYMILI